MDWDPVDDRLIVRPNMTPEVTSGGIILPEMAREKPITGAVIAVGPQCEEIEVGDEVAFSKYGGTEMEVDGEDLLVLRQTDVLARRSNGDTA